MGINIGLDIGAVSLKLAAIGAAGDHELLDRLTARNPDGFFPAEFPAATALAGRPLAALALPPHPGQPDAIHLRPAERVLRARAGSRTSKAFASPARAAS